MSSRIQAVLFDRRVWNTRRARKWLDEKKMKRIKRVDVTNKFYRYRILSPLLFKRFITKKTKDGISLIIGFK